MDTNFLNVNTVMKGVLASLRHCVLKTGIKVPNKFFCKGTLGSSKYAKLYADFKTDFFFKVINPKH
jgi:hypothetical protein